VRGPERGFLLLSCHLGNPDRRVLTTPQLRTLGQRMQEFPIPTEDRDLEDTDLIVLGYSRDMALRILSLLDEEDLLDRYLAKAWQSDCLPLCRVSPLYPDVLKARLGLDAPGCLWAKGDLSILNSPKISLVGSRDLSPVNEEFAREVGRQAALQGYTLVSGNARGADRTAQEACLDAGGRVISIVADSLAQKSLKDRVLYLSEEDFDAEFSSQRALSRNRCIHALGEKTFVAQSACQQGGTWDGTVKNLRFGYSPVFIFADRSPAAVQLTQMGANTVSLTDLQDFSALMPEQTQLF
jgi:predicted Rossmann fold nucleotide-binding protein DprA/Smf involved in DNA uptake